METFDYIQSQMVIDQGFLSQMQYSSCICLLIIGVRNDPYESLLGGINQYYQAQPFASVQPRDVVADKNHSIFTLIICMLLSFNQQRSVCLIGVEFSSCCWVNTSQEINESYDLDSLSKSRYWRFLYTTLSSGGFCNFL